ncbi:carbohydrate kinase family protein [Candidatus Saccharibacteria bacterium]|nr:carbohydrate kinase family protein [Candidatus Saccharibacteria bacterium]
MLRAITLGDAVQDIFVAGSALHSASRDGRRIFDRLELGQKHNVEEFHNLTGGGALNVAVGLSKLGYEVSFCGALGKDAAGLALSAAMEAEDVDTSEVRWSERYPTSTSLILIDQFGERTILTHRGVIDSYNWTDLDRLTELGADVIHVTTMGKNYKILPALFKKLAKAGVKISWNPGVRELGHWNELKDLVPLTDVLIVNKEEARMMVEGRTLSQLARAIPGGGAVVVTDGRNGVLARDKKYEVRALEYEDAKIVDRTGAGDGFSAGFLASYIRKGDLMEAVKWGSANGNNVVKYFGATTGQLHKGARLHELPMNVVEIESK